MHLIEEVRKVTSETTLAELEAVLKKSGRKTAARRKKLTFYDFLGIFTKKEAEAMRKAIGETCETINPDDWK
jgi:hypothetical protein